MRGQDFENKVRFSFAVAKQDVENLKNSVSDWILFLDANQRELKERIRVLEAKMRMLETMQKSTLFE
ncbi:MAG: hypothetical protein QW471_01010 [Candidatus Woesearchaeota archaeon]